jgi:hypothetical protein
MIATGVESRGATPVRVSDPSHSAYPADAVATYIGAPYIEAVAEALQGAGFDVAEISEWTILLGGRLVLDHPWWVGCRRPRLWWDEDGWELGHDDGSWVIRMGGDPLASPATVVAFVHAVIEDPQKAPYPLDPSPPGSWSLEDRLLAAYPFAPE